MSKAYMGAVVRYCGHEGTFVADIRLVAGANVINANGPVTNESLNRDLADYALATHQLFDFPEAGGWFPRLGVFVVPEKQVTQISDAQRKLNARETALRVALGIETLPSALSVQEPGTKAARSTKRARSKKERSTK